MITPARSSVPVAPFVVIGIAVVVVIIVVFALSGSESPEETREADVRRGSDASSSSGSTGRRPPPTLPSNDMRTRLEGRLRQSNLLSLAAACCDRASDLAETRALKREAFRMEEDLARLSAEMAARGEKPYVEERLRPDDEILQFEQTRLSDLPRSEQARLLGNFIVGLKTAGRARVVVRRGPGEVLEYVLSFDPPSSDLAATLRAILATLREDPPKTAGPVNGDPTTPVRPPETSPEKPAESGVFEIFAEASRRSSAPRRKEALQAFVARERESALCWVAARFLEKSDREWRLVYDRLKTPTGNVDGTASGLSLVTFDGASVPLSNGSLQKDVRDPAADALDGWLARYWAAPPRDARRHKEALASLQEELDRLAGKTQALAVLQLFALAHMSELGDEAGDFAAKNGYRKEDERWGKGDFLALLAVTGAFHGRKDLEEAKRAAQGSSSFATRYVAALLEVQEAFSKNSGYESVAKTLPRLTGAGAPPKAAAHMKALFDSLKAAVSCNVCDNGKAPCYRCLGKKRRYVACEVCHALGWAQKPGAPPNTLIRCGACKGVGFWQNANCPTCKASGTLPCFICGGKPWRDGFKGCRACTVCETCKGRKETEADCAVCDGKGRVAPFVAGVPVTLCEACKGEAVLKKPCEACGRSGLADCGKCGGKGPRDGKSRAGPAEVWSAAPCEACGGSGWPLPRIALPCEKCLGLGMRLKPRTSATATLY